MPPGTLDYFALTDCDDGAMRGSKISEHPDDPTMVRVETMTRRSALETMGWTGFDSKDV